ncbi:uncharacterized protein LOC102809546 [Saccoglossus kowalevskii]
MARPTIDISTYFSANLQEKGTYQFMITAEELPDPEQEQIVRKAMEHPYWMRTTKIQVHNCTAIWKQLTDKKYSLVIKCKVLSSIPFYVREDKRSPRVSQILLAVNRMNDIPEGMDVFVELRNCSMDRNKIKELKPDFGQLTTIENLDLGNNQMKKVPLPIFRLHKLKVLRLSVNEIEEIPVGFSALKNLVNFRIGSNRLRYIPDNFGECQSLKYLKLASNRFTELPRALLKLQNLEQLLVSSNKLRTVPLELFENPKLQMFHAEGNPLVQPPLEVVTRGLSAVREYCRAFKQGDIKDDRLKVIFLGASEAGKTTLCKTIVEGKCTVETERTVGIEKHLLDLRDVKLVFWDFAGQLVYYQTHHIFITHDALVVLVVNLAEYKLVDNNFENMSYKELVHLWIANVSMRVPNAVVLVVGTHIDVVKKRGEDPEAKMEDIMERITNQLKEKRDLLESRITTLDERIKDMEESEDVQQDKLEVLSRKIRELKNEKKVADLQVYICPNYVMLCSKEPNTEGLVEFKDAVISLALDQKRFPQRGKNRPKSWKEVENFLFEERKVSLSDDKSRTGMRSHKSLIQRIKKEIFGMETLDNINPVLHYLHNLGEIIWFDDINDLKEHVFVNPSMLIDVFKMVIRHDLEKNLTNCNTKWRDWKIRSSLTKMKFNIYLRKFQEEAFINHKLLYILWMKLPAKESEVGVLVRILEQFGLCHTIEDTDVRAQPQKLDPKAPDFQPQEPTGTQPLSPIPKGLSETGKPVMSVTDAVMYQPMVPGVELRSGSLEVSACHQLSTYHPPLVPPCMPNYYNCSLALGIPPSGMQAMYTQETYLHTNHGMVTTENPSPMYVPSADVEPGYPAPVYCNPYPQIAPHYILPDRNPYIPFCESGMFSTIPHSPTYSPPYNQYSSAPNLMVNGQFMTNLGNGYQVGEAAANTTSMLGVAMPNHEEQTTFADTESVVSSTSSLSLETASSTSNNPDQSKTRFRRKLGAESRFSLFPCYLSEKPNIKQEIWDSKCSECEEINVQFSLFPMKPRGFFEKLSVTCHRKDLDLRITLYHRHIKLINNQSVESLIYITDENDEEVFMIARKKKCVYMGGTQELSPYSVKVKGAVDRT